MASGLNVTSNDNRAGTSAPSRPAPSSTTFETGAGVVYQALRSLRRTSDDPVSRNRKRNLPLQGGEKTNSEAEKIITTPGDFTRGRREGGALSSATPVCRCNQVHQTASGFRDQTFARAMCVNGRRESHCGNGKRLIITPGDSTKT
ncbi:multidrug transporter AcrB [Anopheles sinensis]|uniref:Multidrug transporter AcrB n=1 Tax=Anopheles sinensis TaxID=74873 RepID=A0A084VYC1_ANOSI|nr:multidrug transporter AcrB [Anopheles sinensis]